MKFAQARTDFTDARDRWMQRHGRNQRRGIDRRPEEGAGRRRVHALRDAAGAAAGAVAERQAAVRGQHARQSARDLPRRRRASCTPLGSVVVGLEPVAVAVRNDNEVWVVNHLSDSVSIVARRRRRRRASSRTLARRRRAARHRVRAAPSTSRAFITTAHRGQNSPDDAVRSADAPGVGPRRRLGVRREQPRRRRRRHAPGQAHALRRHAARARRLADGKTSTPRRSSRATRRRSSRRSPSRNVYPRRHARRPGDDHARPGAIDPAAADRPHRQVHDGGHWVDAYGNVFDPFVNVTLPDHDVFAIDATANPPVAERERRVTRTSARRCSTWRSTR